jgi:hypothetical protein
LNAPSAPPPHSSTPPRRSSSSDASLVTHEIQNGLLDRVGALKHLTHLVELSERSESVVMSCLAVGMLFKHQYLLELMALFPRANR